MHKATPKKDHHQKYSKILKNIGIHQGGIVLCGQVKKERLRSISKHLNKDGHQYGNPDNLLRIYPVHIVLAKDQKPIVLKECDQWFH